MDDHVDDQDQRQGPYEPEVEVHSIHDGPQAGHDPGSQPSMGDPLFFQRGRPYVTYALVLINVVVFIIELFTGATDNIAQLVAMGAKDNALIAGGEYWRLITPIFLHGGLDHIAFNSIALFSWGRQAELLYGRAKYLTAYLIAGIMGSLASYVFSDAISVGASGAIFGIFGMILYFRREKPEIFKRVFGAQLLMIVAINLFFGFTRGGQIDNFAHIGGLIGGYLAGNALGLFKKPPKQMRRIIAIIISVVLTVAALIAGQMMYGHEHRAIRTMELSITQKDWQAVISVGEAALKSPDQLSQEDTDKINYYLYASYFTLTQQEAQLDQVEQARQHLATALTYQGSDPEDWLYLAAMHLQVGDYGAAMEALDSADRMAGGVEPRGHYLRAVSYIQQGNPEEGLRYLYLAAEYDPEDVDVQNLIQQLESDL